MKTGLEKTARSLFLGVESSEGREGMQGAGWASASPQPSQCPAHQGIRIPGLLHKRPFPPCQLSCCPDCVAQPFDQPGALCKDNCFKYQRFGVSLALGPLCVLDPSRSFYLSSSSFTGFPKFQLMCGYRLLHLVSSVAR